MNLQIDKSLRSAIYADAAKQAQTAQNVLWRLRLHVAQFEKPNWLRLARSIQADVGGRADSKAIKDNCEGTSLPSASRMEQISRFLDKRHVPHAIVDMDTFAPIISAFAADIFPHEKRNRLCGNYLYFQASSRKPGMISVGPMKIRPSFIGPVAGDLAFLVTNSFVQQESSVDEHFGGIAAQPNASPRLAFIMRNEDTKGAKFMLEQGTEIWDPFSRSGEAARQNRNTTIIYGQLYKHNQWPEGQSPRHFSGWIAIRTELFPRTPPNYLYEPADLYNLYPEIADLLRQRVFTDRTVAADHRVFKTT